MKFCWISKIEILRRLGSFKDLTTFWNLLRTAIPLLRSASAFGITNPDKVYYELRQLFLLRTTTILLRTSTSITNCDNFITNCDKYYELRHLLRTATEQT